MPVNLPHDASDEDLLDAVRAWVRLVEREHYEEAFQYTYQDPYFEWTPELIRDVIYGYGIAEIEEGAEIYKVTSLDTAVENNRNHYEEVNFHMPRKHKMKDVLVVAEIWFDLPLNGYWSDLTATFDVLYMPDCVSLELREIHMF